MNAFPSFQPAKCNYSPYCLFPSTLLATFATNRARSINAYFAIAAL